MDANGFDHAALDQWALRLERVCAVSLPELPRDAGSEERDAFVEGYRDEFGARNASVSWMLRWVLGLGGSDSGEDADPDVRLWMALIGGAGVDLSDISGGVVAPDAYAIEHRTLIECSALHALAHLSLDGRADWERVRGLVDWHTRELQPDNGINRPWGIHAFVARSVEVGNPDPDDALMHAQTMLHNCCVTLGRPDQVSAVLLMDAAGWLRRLSASTR